MSSGYTLADDIATTWKSMQKATHKPKIKFWVCQADSEKSQIVTRKVYTSEDGITSWAEFLEREFPDDTRAECRYVLFDFGFKIYGILYNPDEAPIKKKMLSSTSLAPFKALVGAGCHSKFSFKTTISDWDDLRDFVKDNEKDMLVSNASAPIDAFKAPAGGAAGA